MLSSNPCRKKKLLRMERKTEINTQRLNFNLVTDVTSDSVVPDWVARSGWVARSDCFQAERKTNPTHLNKKQPPHEAMVKPSYANQ